MRRVRFCLTFGWTPEEYDRQDMAMLDEMMLILEKAGNFRIPMRMGV